MLASITPLGERGRHSHYAVTMSTFALGATGAGAITGAAVGGLGAVVIGRAGAPGGPPEAVRAAVLAAALLLAVGLDAGPWRVPGPRRQVDERWLQRYRGWVYGLGYGAQLGAGVTTVITSPATYTAIVAAFLCGDAGSGAVIFGVYGAIRGVTPLAAAGVRTPERLVVLHASLHRSRSPVARAGLAVLLGALGLAVVLAV
jgi:hypothetical protein